MVCKHLADCLPQINTKWYEMSAHESKKNETRSRSCDKTNKQPAYKSSQTIKNFLLFRISIYFQVEECENF